MLLEDIKNLRLVPDLINNCFRAIEDTDSIKISIVMLVNTIVGILLEIIHQAQYVLMKLELNTQKIAINQSLHCP